MTFSIGVVGVGQFGGQFAHLFNLHPGVSEVYVVDERPERAAEAVEHTTWPGPWQLSKSCWSPTSTPSPSSRSAGPTAPLVERALRAGKHVYSAVPMAISEDEIAPASSTPSVRPGNWST
jgi:predicted dehydrogenase